MKIHYDRRPRKGIMLAYPFEEKRLAKWNLPYLVQPKYDGERIIAVRAADWVELYSSTGLPVTNLPHIVAAVKSLPIGIYDGEAYIHQERQRLGGIMRSGGVIEGSEDTQYVIFDLKSPFPQDVRLLTLSQLDTPPEITIAPCWACSTWEEIEEILAEQMALGYEGVILREAKAAYVEKRATTMMKLKPRSSDTYRIIRWQEEISIHGEPKGTLGAFQVMDANGNVFKVGSGFTQAQRKEFWQHRERMIGQMIYVKYQALTDRGVPWFPVFIEVVKT